MTETLQNITTVDAPYDEVILVQLEDIIAARSKDINDNECGTGRRKYGCAMENAWMRQFRHLYSAVNVNATVAEARFKDESRPAYRWILEGDGVHIAHLNDVHPNILEKMSWPMSIRLISPIAWVPGPDGKLVQRRYTRSLEYGRLESTKAMKRESARNRSGQERRSYFPGKKKGRNGQGVKDSWFVRERE